MEIEEEKDNSINECGPEELDHTNNSMNLVKLSEFSLDPMSLPKLVQVNLDLMSLVRLNWMNCLPSSQVNVENLENESKV